MMKLISVLFALINANAYATDWDGVQTVENGVDARCSVDSLSPEEAKGRVLWSIRTQGHEVAQFYSYITTVSKDYVANFGDLQTTLDIAKQSWLYFPNGKPLPRPKYIIWGSGPAHQTTPWIAPKAENAELAKPNDVHIRATCISSCYKPEMRLAFVDGYKDIKTAFDKRADGIITLSENATLEKIAFTIAKVDRYAVEAIDANHQIITINTIDGATLEITPNHPLVDGNGVMREAHTFVLGDALVRADGVKSLITHVASDEYFGKVYNVKPVNQTLLSQVVVAEGYLSGSSWYQNNGAEYMNRDIFRYSLNDELVEF